MAENKAKAPYRLWFGEFSMDHVERMMFSLEGYLYLLNVVPKLRMEGIERLQARAKEVLAIGEELTTRITRQCECGHTATHAKYFWGNGCILQSFHCPLCQPSREELADCYRLVPLRFSSVAEFKGFAQKQFFRMLLHSIGMSSHSSARQAFAFFFPEEAQAQEKAILDRAKKQLGSSQLALALGLI